MNMGLPEPPLPEGWAATTDDQGNVYYYNVHTDATQWERPVMA